MMNQHKNVSVRDTLRHQNRVLGKWKCWYWKTTNKLKIISYSVDEAICIDKDSGKDFRFHVILNRMKRLMLLLTFTMNTHLNKFKEDKNMGFQ